ncbi:MAG: signal peptidase II [Planctomycetota bacterium]
MTKSEQTSQTPANQAAEAERWAMADVKSHVRLWFFAAAGLTADLVSKSWAFDTLSHSDGRVLIKGICNLQLSLNPGALFGLGAGFAPIFVGASVLALMFVLYLFANCAAARWGTHIALGLVLAGALGNLYDRATQEAYVAHFADGGRIIGLLEDKTDLGVTLGEFPHGGNLRFYPGKLDEARSGNQPVVRDFIKIEARLGQLHWPWIFNLADAWLVVGVFFLLISFWTDKRHHAPQPTDAAPEP